VANNTSELEAERVALGPFLRVRPARRGAVELGRAWLKKNNGNVDAVLGELLVRVERLEHLASIEQQVDRDGSGSATWRRGGRGPDVSQRRRREAW
jgi:hypothetical protein